MSRALQLLGLADFPLVEPGQNLAELLLQSLRHNRVALEPGDIVVVAQKIVSKSENRYVRLADVKPGAEALELARRAGKDPRQVELILRESRQVLRVHPGVIIVEHRLGYVHANAGIDKSNIPSSEEDPLVLLLPVDPDASARLLQRALMDEFKAPLAVIVNDSAGRAWRNGTIGMAIGCAGILPLSDQIGDLDLFGRELQVTQVAVADELAAAASLVMGQANEACPVVLVRGADWQPADCGQGPLLRPVAEDLFR
ncbi:MAG: coenzyme F420-0:L-glutamate ligase [Halieaceae bacterium]|nr:coenzyme F420-0:L-glutamate ligase [Halieaceae bacterium]